MARADAAVRTERPPFVPNQGGGNFRRGAPPAPLPATAELKAHAATATTRPAAENFLRAAVDYPAEIAPYADWIDRLAIADPELAAIRAALIENAKGAPNGSAFSLRGAWA